MNHALDKLCINMNNLDASISYSRHPLRGTYFGNVILKRMGI